MCSLVCAFRTWAKGCVTRERSSALIPMPVSSIRISRWASSPWAALTVTVPLRGVNFSAFDTRLSRNLPQPDPVGEERRQVRCDLILQLDAGLLGRARQEIHGIADLLLDIKWLLM